VSITRGRVAQTQSTSNARARKAFSRNVEDSCAKDRVRRRHELAAAVAAALLIDILLKLILRQH
jgi:hypothetical protein